MTPPETSTADPALQREKWEAFRSGLLPELFHPVVNQNEIIHPDVNDVEVIHKEAREQFELLIQRVGDQRLDSGRILLLKGDAGAGKTHLMRVFRNQTHQCGLGYFAYMQMTSHVENYSRYMLRRLLDSLDQPYLESAGPTTALMRLSDALLDYGRAKRIVSDSEAAALRENWIAPRHLAAPVFELSDRLVATLGHSGARHVNLVRALLYLQPRLPNVAGRVFSYLRCDPMTPYDSQWLGGMAVAQDEDEPMTRLRSLARIISMLNGGALVVCLDQLEDVHLADDAGPRFRRAMAAVIELAGESNVLVILASLKEHYDLLQEGLGKPHLDRIEKDPEPVNLVALRTGEEICLLVAKRLAGLYSAAGIETPQDGDMDVYPFTPGDLAKLAGLRTRDVLNWCLKQREEARRNGRLPVAEVPGPDSAPKIPGASLNLDQGWNDFKTEFSELPPQELEILDLLQDSISHCARELPSSCEFRVVRNGPLVDVEIVSRQASQQPRLCLALLNHDARGGLLARKLEEFEGLAEGRIPVALRTVEFPSDPTTVIAKKLGQFITRGGRRVVIQDSELNEMKAFRTFRSQHQDRLDFQRWLLQARPLTQLNCLREILKLEALDQEIASPQESIPDPTTAILPPGTASLPVAPEPQKAAGDAVAQPLRLGIKMFQGDPLFLDQRDLMRHAAFLGGTGSGKTTLALSCIEQLLLAGVPAILIDRKGDLASYGRGSAWHPAKDTEERNWRRARVREAIDIAVYTPGTHLGTGRPLSISIAPEGLVQVPSAERVQLANFSARSLGGLLSYKDTPVDEQKIAILGQAIAVLSELDRPVTVNTLIGIIDSADPALINAIGKLDRKHFKDIVQRLQTLKLLRGTLFLEDVEQLSAETLLGIGSGTGAGTKTKTRLSIINTSFLGDGSIYWVTQFLLEISRFAVRSPRNQLQAVIMLDEADLYLPAQSKPATKAPLENLLRRARAAGIGLMLATQSPGDMDYKSRDQILNWFVGQIKEETAIKKLANLFSETHSNPSDKLAPQHTGEFFAVCGREVVQIKADLSLVHAEPLSSQEILDVAAASKGIGQGAGAG